MSEENMNKYPPLEIGMFKTFKINLRLILDLQIFF